jgi:hypothetical protein
MCVRFGHVTSRVQVTWSMYLTATTSLIFGFSLTLKRLIVDAKLASLYIALIYHSLYLNFAMQIDFSRCSMHAANTQEPSPPQRPSSFLRPILRHNNSFSSLRVQIW